MTNLDAEIQVTPSGSRGTAVSELFSSIRSFSIVSMAVDAADDLRDVAGREVRVARVFALGAEGQVEVLADLPPPVLQAGQDDFLGRPWVGRALENDDLAGALCRAASWSRVWFRGPDR